MTLGSNSSSVVVSCCPGPGGSWGNLAVPPPSKEGESPSNKVLLVLSKQLEQLIPVPDWVMFCEVGQVQ